MFDVGHILEVHSVWNLEALHAICMAPLLEVLLKGTSAPVAGATANLALELNTKAMQLVKPVRNLSLSA